MKKTLMVVILVVAAAVVCGIIFLLGDKYGVEHMTITTATPTDLAQTMLQDEFYSTFRERTIITTGTIASISRAGNSAIITFPTKSLYKARCSFNTAMPRLARGQTLTVMSEGASAQRQSTAVLLEDCQVLK